MPEKFLIPLLLTAGAAAIAFGMLDENNYIFIAGIVMVAAGYLFIRKRIKGSVDKEKE